MIGWSLKPTVASLEKVKREQIIAFRLSGHHLAERLPPGSLLEAASACGIGDYPPGSASLAFMARVCGLTPQNLDDALRRDKTLLQTRSLRTSPHVFPTSEAAVFTTGLLPDDEASLRYFMGGAEPALTRVGISATGLLARVDEALRKTLDERSLGFRRLSGELTELVEKGLAPDQRDGWVAASPYGANTCMGEALVHFALYALALTGRVCYVPGDSGRANDEAQFARTEQWLGYSLPVSDPAEARAALLRRFLRCHGPSNAQHFAQWAGIAPSFASSVWKAMAPSLVPVDFAGKRVWLHFEDLEPLSAPPAPRGVRLLPPHDPYLQGRDRATTLPDPDVRPFVWRAVGSPGVVLFKGEVIALWRAQKRGKRVRVGIQPLGPLPPATRADIEDEVGILVTFRAYAAVDLVFEEEQS